MAWASNKRMNYLAFLENFSDQLRHHVIHRNVKNWMCLNIGHKIFCRCGHLKNETYGWKLTLKSKLTTIFSNLMSELESIDFPKLKVIYLKERFLKNYLTDLLKIPYTSRRIKIELHAWLPKRFSCRSSLYHVPLLSPPSTRGQLDGLIWLANPRQKVLRHGNRMLARVRRPYFQREKRGRK